MLVAQEKAQSAQTDYQLALQKMGIEHQTEIQKAEIQSRTDLAKTVHDAHADRNMKSLQMAHDHISKIINPKINPTKDGEPNE